MINHFPWVGPAEAVHFQTDSKGQEVPVNFHGLVGPRLGRKNHSGCSGIDYIFVGYDIYI